MLSLRYTKTLWWGDLLPLPIRLLLGLLVLLLMSLLRLKYTCLQYLGTQILSDGDCFLVTADVASLYPNVDTKKALIALDLLLREAGAPKTPLLIQLARLVFENNYLSLEFCPDIFHQKFGIAMGTPFSVTVVNAFMYHHEKDIVDHYSQYLILYKRFIDDIFAIWCWPKDTLLEFLGALNSKDQRIQLTHCISELSISFLDLFLYRDGSSSVLQFSIFQKPLNKYLYIPFESFHPSSNKKAFIKGELIVRSLSAKYRPDRYRSDKSVKFGTELP